MFRKLIPLALINVYAVLSAVWAVTMQPPAAATAVKGADTAGPSGNSLVDEINRVRLEYGRSTLELDGGLTDIAAARTEDMVGSDYYAHYNAEGIGFDTMMRAAGIRYGFACENLDISFTPSDAQYVADWLASKHGHRECLLSDRVTRIGVSTAPKQVTGAPGAALATIILSD